MEPSDFLGKTIIVTGAASGVGKAIATRFMNGGGDVVVADIDLNHAKETAESLNGSGTSYAVQVDVRDEQSVKSMVEYTLKNCDSLDVLVNNAAILIESELDDVTDDQFDEIVSTNLRAPFVLSVAASKGMKERKWGRIVNMSSVGARTGGISQSCVYAATKAGLIAVTKNFARNLGPYGITTNAVAPGAIATPMAVEQSLSDESLLKRVVEATPTGRLGSADEAAATVVFLASEEASFVNGVCLDVNGGWVMT